MVFPNFERVVYKKNPLEEVICQLRFPPILRIDSGNAADFQDVIRQDYPLYSEASDLPDLPLPEPFLKALALPALGQRSAKNFISSDNVWMISLANNFVALTTSRYTRWEGFRSRLKVAVAALENVYNPSFYTRVGLRYKNVIRRSHFDVSDVPWSELLSPSILSELGSELADAVKETTSTTLIDLNNSTGQVRIRRALKADSSTGEPTYSIDADFFTHERTNREAISEQLDYFNAQAARFFRWCSTPKLHDAMAPEPMP